MWEAVAVTTGIIGYAYDQKKIARTKHYASSDIFLKELSKDMKANKEQGEPSTTSFLAIPFVGNAGEIALVLYADCKEFNFFADDGLVKSVSDMCHGFANLLDWLETSQSLPTFQNFPLERGTPMKREKTVYKTVQETLNLPVPLFKSLAAFNYEGTIP